MFNLLLITNDQNQADRYLETYCKKQQIKNPNVFRFGEDPANLSIELFRDIIRITERHFPERSMLVINNFQSTTPIMQNTFLKTLEEHQEELIFCLVASSTASVLPTIISRCQVVELRQQQSKLNQSEIEAMTILLKKLEINPGLIVTNELRYTPKTKKETLLTFLNQFISYGQLKLANSDNPHWLAARLKRALTAKTAIEINNLDPELALDHVFL